MRKIITKTFGLRDDEIRISFLMLLYIFIIITVLLIVKPTVNALFVSKLGADNLPFGYLLVASVAVLTSYFYNKAIRIFSLVKVTVISLVTFSLSFIVLSLVIKYALLSNWILYFYYVFISLFAVVATSQFWLFANMVFNAREAKRNFGFIGAGGIAGGIFGGYLTSIIATNFGNEFAVFLAALLILICIPILKKIYNSKIKFLNSFKRKQVIANEENLESSSLRLISKSKHLTYIALITGIGVIVAKLVDFQFSDFAQKAMPDSDDLAAFFGFWFSTFNVVALVIQLFLTNKVLTRLGVSSTLLILPLAIAFGSLLFLTFPELWVLIIIKAIDGSAKQSVNKAAIELSIMPIPIQVKNQAKSYIDVVIDSLATGFAGFLLIFLIKRLDLDTSYITVIILLFTFVWILFIYRLREAYFSSFKENIQKTLSLEFNKNKKSENTIIDIKNIFLNGDEESILNALERLKDYKQTSFNTSVIKLLEHPSKKINARAIEYLDSFEGIDILDKVESLVNEKDDLLAYMALDYLLAHSPISDESFFNKYLNHENEYIANGALLSLAKQSFNNAKLGVNYEVVTRLEEKVVALNTGELSDRKEVLAGLLMSIAYARMTSNYHLISKYLKDDNAYIAKFATISAGITSDEVFIKDLLDSLSEKKHRKRAIRALSNYGPKIIDFIFKLDKNGTLKPSTKKYIPKIVESFKNEKAVRVLLRLLRNKNAITRLAASNSLTKILKKNTNLSVSARVIKNQILRESSYYKNTLEIIASIEYLINIDLVDEVKEKNQEVYEARKNIISELEILLDANIKCIFNLLSLVYNEEDIKMTYVGIQSEIKEAKINSLEFLDNILQRKIKTMVLPIIEYYVVDDNHYKSSIINLKIIREKKFLNRIVTLGNVKLKSLVIKYIQASNNKRLISVLLPLNKFKNKEVKELATKTYHLSISNNN
ncbi:MFS transporter [Polaribacter sp. ALD11]|uniref:Npt1/Npt2 family nucleotide transporter n=1 Tax=Polaribacter sp. ALD11 TaxID=2058137 RepID=UPI000C3155CA|nr:Npt1/Npt2 family nucleotide transporter [Polaribacter sp. ALD11]AUC86570.1 MFS transporter [Polaribacter sp. ALD11]